MAMAMRLSAVRAFEEFAARETIERIIMRDVLSYIDSVSVFVELLFIIIFANERHTAA